MYEVCRENSSYKMWASFSTDVNVMPLQACEWNVANVKALFLLPLWFAYQNSAFLGIGGSGKWTNKGWRKDPWTYVWCCRKPGGKATLSRSSRPSNASLRMSPVQGLCLLLLKDWHLQPPSKRSRTSRVVTGWQSCQWPCVNSSARLCCMSVSSVTPCWRAWGFMSGCWAGWRAPLRTFRAWTLSTSRTWLWTSCCGLGLSRSTTPVKGLSLFSFRIWCKICAFRTVGVRDTHTSLKYEFFQLSGQWFGGWFVLFVSLFLWRRCSVLVYKWLIISLIGCLF